MSAVVLCAKGSHALGFLRSSRRMLGAATIVQSAHAGSSPIAESYEMPSAWVSYPKHNLKNINEYNEMYKLSIDEPHKFWTNIAQQFEWKGQV